MEWVIPFSNITAVIPVILTISGIFCVVIASVRITFKEVKIFTEQNAKAIRYFGFALLICGLISGAAGTYNKATVTPTETPTVMSTVTSTETPEIKIDYPVGKASWKQNIAGTAKNIPKGTHIWLVLYAPSISLYYPITELNPDKNGEWIEYSTIIGTKKEDRGCKFDIIVYLVEDNDTQEKLENYLKKCTSTDNWPGISKLPDGADECSRVTVTRI